jgi:hypothetical protein
MVSSHAVVRRGEKSTRDGDGAIVGNRQGTILGATPLQFNGGRRLS